MNPNLTHDELSELVACHAVGALDGDERRLAEEHIETCAECAAEFFAHLDTLASLTPDEATASSSVWAAIDAEINSIGADTAPPQGATVVSLDARRRRTWMPTAVAAAVALVLGLAFGMNLDDGTPGSGQIAMADLIAATFDAPDATITPLASGETAYGRVAVLPDGTAAIDTDGYDLAPGRVLQVWAVVPRDAGENQVISVGLLDHDGEGLFVLDGQPSVLVVTDEPSGGSVTAVGPTVAITELTSA